MRGSNYDFSLAGSPDQALTSLGDFHGQFTSFKNVLSFDKRKLTRRAVEESAHKETNPRLRSIYHRLQNSGKNGVAIEKNAIIKNLHKTSQS